MNISIYRFNCRGSFCYRTDSRLKWSSFRHICYKVFYIFDINFIFKLSFIQ